MQVTVLIKVSDDELLEEVVVIGDTERIHRNVVELADAVRTHIKQRFDYREKPR